jgi:hypothetical protein
MPPTRPHGGTYDPDRSSGRSGSDRWGGDRGSTRRETDRRDYSRGNYSRPDTDRRDYSRGDYSRGGHSRGDYGRSSDGYGSRSHDRSSWLRFRARNFHSERRSWRQRGGYRGYRLPNSYFHSHFGRNRWFRANTLQFVFVSGNPYFDYDDYRFTMLDPYPEYWGDDWYHEDDLYVDHYDDGYYLCNRRYPDRPGVAISISLRF